MLVAGRRYVSLICVDNQESSTLSEQKTGFLSSFQLWNEDFPSVILGAGIWRDAHLENHELIKSN